MITIRATPELAPLLRLLVATARDLCREKWIKPYDMSQLQAQADLIVAACGLDLTCLLSVAAAIQGDEPVCIESGDPPPPQNPSCKQCGHQRPAWMINWAGICANCVAGGS